MLAAAKRALSRVRPALLAILLATLPGICFAQAGSVIASNGENHLDRNSRVVKPLRAGTAIQPGDAIVTAPTGRLQIRFVDGALVSMQPNTRFRVDQHRYGGNEEKGFFSLVRGAIRMASGLIGKKQEQDFRLTTPSATIGIRGTHFVVEHTVCDPGCSPGKTAGTRVSVTQGRVVVFNAGGSIEIGQHQSAEIVDENTAPERVAWTPAMSPRDTGQTRYAVAAPGNVQHDVPAANGTTDQPRDDNGNVPVNATPPPNDGQQQTSLPRWSARSPDPDRDRQLASRNPLDRINFEFDRPDPLPEGARDSRRDKNGQLPELALRTPEQLPDVPGDGGSSELPEQSPSNPGDDNNAEGPVGSPSDPDPTPGPAPDPTPDPTPAPLPGPAAGSADASGWLLSVQPLHSIADGRIMERIGTQLTFDENTGLLSIGQCNNGICLARGSARLADAGHDEYAAWGRWTDGAIEVSVFGLRTAVNLTERQGLHYLAGTPAVSLPASGAFTYNLTAATAPTMSHDWYSPGQFSGRAGVWFAPGEAARVGLEADIELSGDQFTFATTGGADNPAASQFSLDANQQFSGELMTTGSTENLPWMCGGDGCGTHVRGGLFGPTGERLGVSYSIRSESESTTIDGVSIFSRPTGTP